MLICPVSSPVYLASVYSPEVSPLVGAFIFCRNRYCLVWGGALFGAWWGVGGHPVHNLWIVFFLREWDGKRAGHRVILGVAGLSGEFRYPLKGERERKRIGVQTTVREFA